MGFIARQPNGLLCVFSTIVDCPTHWNMSDEEYINMKKEQAAIEAKKVLKNSIRPFEWIQQNFIENNMTQEEFNGILKEMIKREE